MRGFRRAPEAATSKGEVDSLLRQSLWAALDRDHERVGELLARIVGLDSDDVDAYLALARLYRERGEVGRAIGIHQTLILRRDLGREQRVSALSELGADFRRGGYLRRAVAAYEEVLEYDGAHRAALAALEELMSELGDHARALAFLRRRARADGRADHGREAALLVHVARAERADGRRSAARRTLRRALRRDSRSEEAHFELGELEAECGRSKRALAAWQAVLDLAGERASEVYPKLEAGYTAMDRSRDYEALLRGRLDREPPDPAAGLALALHLAAHGERDGAVSELRRVLDRQPGELAVHVALGRLILSLGRQVDSVKGYAELLALLEQRMDRSRQEGRP